MIRVALVEDQNLIRASLKQALHDFADIVVVAEAATPERAVWLATHLVIDVMLLDIGLGGEASGLDVARTLQGNAKCPRIIAVTSYDDIVPQLRELGVVGLVPKMSEIDVLVEAIRAVAAGGEAFPVEFSR